MWQFWQKVRVGAFPVTQHPQTAYRSLILRDLTRYASFVARKQRPETWAERGFKNSGILTTSRALKFALGWGLFMASEGHEPENIEEYAEVMQESRATAFRDQQAFRQAFPDEESPTRMNKVSGAQDRYDELYKKFLDFRKVNREAQPLVYLVGGSPAF